VDPDKLRIGTAGWSYPKGEGRWAGIFYPKGTRDELGYYSRRFNVVEVNVSFYRPLSPRMVESWVKRTPESFEFTVKLYQKFTHPKMYAETQGASEPATQKDVEQFKRGLDPLMKAKKFGCLLAQFPPSFKKDVATLGYLQELLESFKDYPVVVELRHGSWRRIPDVLNLLNTYRASWVWIDEPKFTTSVKQSFEPVGPIYYLRLHGRNREMWWKKEAGEHRYDYLYSETELQAFSQAIQANADRVKKVYVIANNHYRAKAAVNAIQLKAQLRLPVTGTYNPELVKEYPQLAELIKVEAQKASDGK